MGICSIVISVWAAVWKSQLISPKCTFLSTSSLAECTCWAVPVADYVISCCLRKSAANYTQIVLANWMKGTAHISAFMSINLATCVPEMCGHWEIVPLLSSYHFLKNLANLATQNTRNAMVVLMTCSKMVPLAGLWMYMLPCFYPPPQAAPHIPHSSSLFTLPLVLEGKHVVGFLFSPVKECKCYQHVSSINVLDMFDCFVAAGVELLRFQCDGVSQHLRDCWVILVQTSEAVSGYFQHPEVELMLQTWTLFKFDVSHISAYYASSRINERPYLSVFSITEPWLPVPLTWWQHKSQQL